MANLSIPPHVLGWAQASDSDPAIQAALIAVGYYESSWRADAVGDGGLSFGWLQYYTAGGLGDGYSQAQLFDPVFEGRLAAQHIRQDMASGKSLYQALWPWSVRDSAWALYPDVLAQIGVIPPGPIGCGDGYYLASDGLCYPNTPAEEATQWLLPALGVVVGLLFLRAIY